MSDLAVLLPGWGTDPARFRTIAAALEVNGIRSTVHHVHPDALIDGLARRLRHVAGQLAADGHRIHLVGHSLGGLVAAWAATDEHAPPLATVTTINTPWRGTWLAWTGTGELAAQLRYGSDAVVTIRRRLTDHLAEPTGPSWHVIGTALDLGTPPSTALRPGPARGRLERRLVWSAGHSTSLLGTGMARRVATFIAAHDATAVSR